MIPFTTRYAVLGTTLHYHKYEGHGERDGSYSPADLLLASIRWYTV